MQILVYPEPETYSESWYIQNQRDILNLVYSEPDVYSESEAYLEPWYIQN